MSAPVFLAEGTRLGEYAVGSVFVLDGAEGRHAGVVQRRGPGERIDVVDGAGLRLEGVVESVDDGHVHLRVGGVVAEEPPVPVVTLVQALAKGDRDEQAIEAATETGVDAVVPWQAERSIVVWRGPRAAKSQAKWVATVRAATKQARRARVPEVAAPVTTKQLAARARDVVGAGGVVVVLHEEATLPLREVPLPEATGHEASGSEVPATGMPVSGASVSGAGGSPVPELLVVVGPEGGISEAEVDALTAAGAVTARLGPHVMRTSTAGPVAVAMLNERLGRWS
ncbi:16S rRNA (uracil(1498)-N(3))-methyltransferase [Myceligenerans pegani]|uniref:Ribosomal RNA small subunit methyltransferase E n=1 Tax=Myceligenerans pegani TaxID=2776917 RepID=A0ABR9N2B1_9MICO|nr:16S rRNA (uracil(1498)-N(3))-methyltransferase [Myceligenerans sp. TRM 65318]MBE1877782.1 16S rRNA (uracil(1498)-N(3))-methyltransferase [Myceligenerans sp. TRM 65318]MBE3020053.1 16S rRNA (uracil(1498)-N(3))-methyltransferase [Myceligenerans sp. TRM 65318]